jgi:hypothetical protein
MVLKNPFSPENSEDIIVLLDGVSGPGTFGLAEALTGGITAEKGTQSELFLKDLNQAWQDAPNARGIEAFIKVQVAPSSSPSGDDGHPPDGAANESRADKSRVRALAERLSDDRIVAGWELCDAIEEVESANPRPIPT